MVAGGSSSSRSSQSTTTTNIDKRIANDGGLIAQDGSRIDGTNNYNVNTLDGGAIDKAFDFAKVADATSAAGFSQLLKVASDLTTKTQDTTTTLASRFQDNVLQAYDSAKTGAAGGIDQKTMIDRRPAAAALVAIKSKSAKG